MAGGRYPYFIIVDHKLAGFELINRHGACDRSVNWSVAEFFVSYPYRRKGVATIIMERIFKLHQVFWHIKYHPKNATSKIFWNKLVRSVSNGCYEVVEGNEGYFGGTASQVLAFKIYLRIDLFSLVLFGGFAADCSYKGWLPDKGLFGK